MSKQIIFMFLVGCSQLVQADVLLLKNGDRISGTVVSMQQSQLKFASKYAEMTVPWRQVVEIRSEKAVSVELNDASKINGVLSKSQGGLAIKNKTTSQTVVVSMETVNAINPAQKPDQALVSGKIHVGGSKASGNTDNQAFHADAEIVAKMGDNRFTAGAEYNQAANNDEESSNNFRAYGKYDHYFSADWYGLLYADFTKDRFQDLNYRSAFGVGVGHELWNDKTQFLSAELGVAYTIEDYSEAEDRTFMSGRWALDFHYWIVEDRLQFFHNHEGLLSLEDMQDVLLRTRSGFKMPLYRGLDLLTQFDFDYDNKPAAGKKSSDTRYIVGVGYNW